VAKCALCTTTLADSCSVGRPAEWLRVQGEEGGRTHERVEDTSVSEMWFILNYQRDRRSKEKEKGHAEVSWEWFYRRSKWGRRLQQFVAERCFSDVTMMSTQSESQLHRQRHAGYPPQSRSQACEEDSKETGTWLRSIQSVII